MAKEKEKIKETPQELLQRAAKTLYGRQTTKQKEDENLRSLLLEDLHEYLTPAQILYSSVEDLQKIKKELAKVDEDQKFGIGGATIAREWNEEDHPRDDEGKFTFKNGDNQEHFSQEAIKGGISILETPKIKLDESIINPKETQTNEVPTKEDSKLKAIAGSLKEALYYKRKEKEPKEKEQKEQQKEGVKEKLKENFDKTFKKDSKKDSKQFSKESFGQIKEFFKKSKEQQNTTPKDNFEKPAVNLSSLNSKGVINAASNISNMSEKELKAYINVNSNILNKYGCNSEELRSRLEEPLDPPSEHPRREKVKDFFTRKSIKQQREQERQERYNQKLNAIKEETIKATNKYADAITWTKPLKLMKVTSPYGKRFHPVYKRIIEHDGIDLHADMGTPLYAPYGGKVIFAGWKKGYGNTIIIEHTLPNGEKVATFYAHLSSFKVKEGDVARGKQIACTGKSGVGTGPHLHIGAYRIKGKEKISENPMKIIQVEYIFKK